MKKLFALLMALVFACTFLTAVCETAAPLRIVCTTFPQFDWTRQLLGDRADDVELTLLLDNGIDLHNYQPTADDIIKIARSDLFIYVGGESESWVDDALKGVKNKDMKVIKLFESVGSNIRKEEHKEGMQEEHVHTDDDEEEYDEHVWLSLDNAKLICSDICSSLCELDSANADKYKSNLAAYTDKLSALDEEYSDMAESADTKTLLFGDRFPFRYLLDDYGLDYYAAFNGCSAETEASFETIANLAEKIDELDLDTVFIIENSDDSIAKSIISSSKNKNAKIQKLNSIQSVTSDDISRGASYISIMKDNLDTLKKVLN